MGDKNFNKALLREMKANLRNFHEGNWDAGARGVEPPPIGFLVLDRVAQPIRRAKARIHAFCLRTLRPLAIDLMRLIWPFLEYRVKLRRFEGIGFLYDRLEDAESKDLLVKLFAFRAMGHRKVKLPQNNVAHWNNIRRVERLEVVGPPVSVEFMNITLQLRDLSAVGFNMKAYCTGGGGSYIFLQRQYELHRGDVNCEAETGDVVIDAGACWGETSLYFAHQVGDTGLVIAYEFIPSNLVVLDRNLAENPVLTRRIKVLPQPVWNESGETLYYVDWGPGSRVSFAKMREDFADTQCLTTTIDDTVEQEGLLRIDFIKMDIEGAELYALKGAEKALKKFHPKLAISLYHSIQDFNSIPRYLESLGLAYKYYLDHHTIYENETVLFAVPQRSV